MGIFTAEIMPSFYAGQGGAIIIIIIIIIISSLVYNHGWGNHVWDRI